MLFGHLADEPKTCIDVSSEHSPREKKKTFKSWTSHCKLSTKEQAKETVGPEKASWNIQRYTGCNCGNYANRGGKESGREAKEQACWTRGQAAHMASLCPRRANKNLYAIGEEECDANEETIGNEEALQERGVCLKRANTKQWHEVSSRREKTKTQEIRECLMGDTMIKLDVNNGMYTMDMWI